MGLNDKPFACTTEGCQMTFTNEDHLNVHKKKHDMVLNFGITCKGTVTADQTPTPTRFIRNCEEVGLFQDLQNVNPFEETFKKAIEHSNIGIAHISDSPHDDSLHTPQILDQISENLDKPQYTSDKHFDDATTIDEDILRIDSQNSSSRDGGLSPIENSDDKGNNFSYQLELSTSNEREFDFSSSNSNDATVEDLSIIKKNLNSYLLKSPTIKKHDKKSDVKEKIKEALYNKRKSEIKPLDLKLKDNGKPRQRINLKSKLRDVGIESSTIKIEHQRNVNLYDKNLNEVEKRRAMNRMAQMRSRKRKKMWLDRMEQEIEKLKRDNKSISTENQKLKEENVVLKSMLLKHTNCSLATDLNIQNGKIPTESVTEKEIVSIQPLPLLYNAYTTESSPISFKQSQAIPTGRTTNKLSFVQKPLPKLLPKIKHDNHANSESIR